MLGLVRKGDETFGTAVKLGYPLYIRATFLILGSINLFWYANFEITLAFTSPVTSLRDFSTKCALAICFLAFCNFGIKSSTLKTFAKSNGISFLPSNNRDLSNKDLGKLITKGTIYLECFMTIAKIEKQ